MAGIRFRSVADMLLGVAGEVTDPAHCVEGVVTVRGPAYTEFKPLL
jgi:hypothetical protein